MPYICTYALAADHALHQTLRTSCENSRGIWPDCWHHARPDAQLGGALDPTAGKELDNSEAFGLGYQKSASRCCSAEIAVSRGPASTPTKLQMLGALTPGLRSLPGPSPDPCRSCVEPVWNRYVQQSQNPLLHISQLQPNELPTHQGGGTTDLLAGGVVLGSVARALELVLSLWDTAKAAQAAHGQQLLEHMQTAGQ